MTGGMPISYSVDHCGPMRSSTENVARLLTAIAGPDAHDPRTINAKVGNYIEALGRGAKGLRIGLLKEGFNHPVSDHSTSAKVRAAANDLKSNGAVVEEVSVPMHLEAPHIWTGVILEGAAEMMIKGYGMGNNWPGYYTLSLQEAFARGWSSRPDDVSETVKLVLLLGEYMHRHYHNRYHAKGRICACCCAPLTTRRSRATTCWRCRPFPSRRRRSLHRTRRAKSTSTPPSTCSRTPARSM
jgi:amidase